MPLAYICAVAIGLFLLITGIVVNIPQSAVLPLAVVQSETLAIYSFTFCVVKTTHVEVHDSPQHLTAANDALHVKYHCFVFANSLKTLVKLTDTRLNKLPISGQR